MLIRARYLPVPLTHLDDNCIIGHKAVICAQAIESARIALTALRVGHNVTVGATLVVMSVVTIDDEAIVSASALV